MMMQIMTISVCTMSSSGVVQYGVMAPDSQSRNGAPLPHSEHGAGQRPSLVFCNGSDPRTSALGLIGGQVQQVREHAQHLPGRPASPGNLWTP